MEFAFDAAGVTEALLRACSEVEGVGDVLFEHDTKHKTVISPKE